MKRILFVDDEPNILSGLEDLLRKYRRTLEFVFATSGEEALNQLQQRPFDAVVTDMRMPGMDGAALLDMVRQEYPDAVRIILSGHADRNAIFSAVPVFHQYLAKPCDPETLCNVIERACALRCLLSDPALRGRIGGLDKLPSLPAIYTKLMAVISQSETSMDAVAEVLQEDSAMTAKILQVVNSACFSPRQPISDISHAVKYLGIDVVKNLVLTVHVFTTAGERYSRHEPLRSLQEHAIETARLAKEMLTGEQAQQAFTAALLHDVGHVVLSICVPDLYDQVIERSQSEHRPLHEVEQEMLNLTHAEAGAYLLGIWGLPFPIVEAVAFHHNPATGTLGSAIFLAENP